MKSIRLFSLSFSLLVASNPMPAPAQGMPPEARANIHALFDGHASIRRTVTETPDGYVSLTESHDPKVAAALKAHHRQMGERLKSGLMVRRWDPVYEEYIRFHDQIEHRVEPTAKGLRITARGLTPDAIKVARNHAAAVTDFVTNGWAAHDTIHPTVAGKKAADGGEAVSKATSEAGGESRDGSGCRKVGAGCCQGGACCGRRATRP